MKNEQRLLKTWLHIGGLGLVGGLALALFVAQPASAALITFEDVVNGPFNNDIRTSATSDGFGFTSTHFHVINNPTQCAFGGCVANGTQYAAEDAPTLAGPVTMTPSGGGTFSLVSFDGAELFLSDSAAAAGGFANATSIHVVGNLSGGGTITADFALDGLKDGAGGVADFQPFVFPAGFTNLTSAVWSGTVAAGGTASMSFDNIVTGTGPVGVPEPSILLFLGTSLTGLAVVAWRHRG